MFMDSNTSNSNNPTVVSISGCILTPEEEQSKWLAESLEVVHRAAGNLAYYVSQEDFSGSITGGVKEDATQHADPMAADENTMKLQKNAGENRTMQNFYLILKATTEMLDELRTSLLAPQTYYELYVVVFDKIQVFITYCDDLIRHKCITPEMLYETVQFTGALLSRLYLLVCAGSVYLSTMDNKLMASSVAKGKEGEEGAPEGRCAQLDIFVDLLEMSKGVQHPTRGLFLRHFLLTMMKGKLPGDFGFEAEGNVDAADIVYYTAHMLTTNLREMNWLWIRMESNRYSRPTSLSTAAENENNGSGAYGSPVSSSAPVKDKKGTLLTNESVTSSSAKIKETNKKNTLSDRNELKVLVGMNIVRISQLDGVTREMYKEKILPNLIPIVTKYREPLAQQYLVEILIQVFPDDFHLDTLETLLKIIFNLSPNVHVVPLVRFLLERLERFIVEYYEEKVNVVKDPSRQKDQNETEYRIEDKLFKNVFATIMNCLSTCEVSYEKVQPMEKLIRKTNNIPPPTPVLIVRYLEILTDVARFSLSVDLAAEKWVAATGSKDEEEGKTSKAVKHISSLLRYATERIQEGPELTPEMLLGAERLVTTVLSVPSVTENISTLLEIDAIPALVAKLPFISRRQVAVTLCETAQRYPEKHIETLEHAARLFELMDPLLTVQQDAPEDLTVLYKYNVKDEFIDEQNLVCRTLHLLESKKDPLLFIKMLTGARRLLGAGGPTRIPGPCRPSPRFICRRR
ncbi:vacuolar sorting-associated-like protein [Angomonas deanei]|uniref:Vacuolar protein sorting-associated protein 35, putative n=1 Tax=Angomonas deanei TaxID=59799 RepID=A0A7G2CPN3_9TRYP|nr:vacuolar sorting-associated-like protein [Angomonas deanei]CAD2220921.1 Vacuolar protein sorting-associated protein 35, putative [Angomonas deanei]|eukprot:EPY31289.1 vacuolar sorting-associated-like protein [Angomonas deanei]